MFATIWRSLSEFTPSTYLCIQEGYSKERFLRDLFAGITIGVISLPLTMAYAIASGLSPDKGLFTGIVAGFLISLLGGSRVQIGGPTGAFVVIVYSVVERHGYEGLALATLLAGGMMILFSIARAGILLKFIPHAVTTGFTAGIALTIFSSQVKDLLGLPIGKIPADFISKWQVYLQYMADWNPWALSIGVSCIAGLFLLRSFFPRLPAPLFAVGLSSLAVYLFEIPVETILSKFGTIPNMLPAPSLPYIDFNKIQEVFPDAITIALLGSIESLLSAVVADGMTGHRHRSNTELFAQGIANMGSVFFGGIPATGAVARTAANIRMGATSPVAGMIHAVTLLFMIVFFAPVAAHIPLPALAAVLIYVAWYMSEMDHIASIMKGSKSDIFVLAITFFLTVLIDLTVAVQAGVILAAFLFMKKMTDTSAIKTCRLLIAEDNERTNDSDLILRKDVPEDVAVFEVQGPLFFGIAHTLSDPIRQLNPSPRVFILRLHKVPLIDSSGIHALKDLAKICHQKNIELYISGVTEDQLKLFHNTGLIKHIEAHHFFTSFHSALAASQTTSQSAILTRI